jgi:hypothetical protein
MSATDEDRARAVDPQIWHHGRRWNGPDRLSRECNCPKTACGLTEFGKWDPACDFHGLTKTTRQAHAPQDCPGHEVLDDH